MAFQCKWLVYRVTFGIVNNSGTTKVKDNGPSVQVPVTYGDYAGCLTRVLFKIAVTGVVIGRYTRLGRFYLFFLLETVCWTIRSNSAQRRKYNFGTVFMVIAKLSCYVSSFWRSRKCNICQRVEIARLTALLLNTCQLSEQVYHSWDYKYDSNW